MKRAIVLVAGLLVLAAPAEAAVPEWSPGGLASTSPTYTLPIHVVDGVRATFHNRERRREWVQQMTKALDAWGLPYYVTRRPEWAQPFLADDVNVSTYSYDPLTIPDAVVMVRGHFSNGQDSAGWSDAGLGGIMFMVVWSGWWESPANIRIVTAHEFGHAIGFQHGGTGVMMGGNVSDEERALAATYYEA